jgi:pimeloyl-ACP methyl ester carboxylesterase
MDWLKITVSLLLLSVGLAFSFALYVGARAAWFEYNSGVPWRGKVERPANEPLMAAAHDATFKTKHGLAVHGWYLPGNNRAAVLLAHGSGGDRRDLLPEARALASAGFSVLMYDHPGHAESEGPPDWYDTIPEAMLAAVDWLTLQSEVDAQRIGAFGFSMGAYVLARAGARDQRIAAAVFAGCFSDAIAQAHYEYRRWGPLTTLPALWVMRAGGHDPASMRPVDDIAKFGSRPLLFIAGARDGLVPASMARELYEHASGPRQLWIIESAAHGDYAARAGAAYDARLREFFARALLDPDAAGGRGK